MRLFPFLSPLTALLLLPACSLGPDFRRPSAGIPASFRATAETGARAWAEVEWWRGFCSPTLDRLEDAARARNQDIAAAVARVRQADAQARISGAALLPTVSATSGAQYEEVGGGRGRSGSSFSTVNTTTATGTLGGTAIVAGGTKTSIIRTYSGTGNASYEVDFWGKNRALADSAQASAVFSRWDQAVVALTVVTNVATTWFTALAYQDRLVIATNNLRSAEQTAMVIRARVAVGTATALDAAQQDALVAGQRAVIPNLRNQEEQQRIALGILAGTPPEALDTPSGTLVTLSLPEVAPGLPADLLERRPDVAEVEAELVAANANIRAARAAFFPSVTLTGQGGYSSAALNSLFNPGSLLLSVVANATQPIFDGGTLRGQLEQTRGREDELVADYRKAILQAFTDVEQALTAYRLTTEQEKLERLAVATAQRAADIARAQLEAGTVDITTVLQAQTTLFTDQDTLAQVRLTRFQALVNLYKALGGGWTRPDGPVLEQFPGLTPGRLGGGMALPVGGNLQ